MNFYYEKEKTSDCIDTNEPLAYPAHFQNSIELVYINNGTARAIADGIEYDLREGDFFIAFPETVHSYDNCHNMNSTIIIVAATRFPEYSAVFSNKRPISPHVRNAPPEAKEIITFLVKNKDKYDSHTIRGMLLSVFGILLSCMELTEISRASHVTPQEILRYCELNCKTGISIEKMSKDLRISKSCISHTFSEKFRVPFRTYINTLRLQEAVRLLENTPKSMTEIASESGFETIRTFNRAFNQRFGISPAKYRKKKTDPSSH